MTITVRNYPVGAKVRLVVTSPAGDKRHTLELAVVGADPWSTAVSLGGMPGGSSAELTVMDAQGNVVTRSSTTLP